MRVEFISPHIHNKHTGIGRYIYNITNYLKGYADISFRKLRYLPFSNHFTPLQNIPIGIRDHMPNSIVHFTQIMGCGMMLFERLHPTVATVHDLGSLELPEEGKMLDPVSRQILRISLAGLKRVDKIIAVSEFTRQGIIDHLGLPEDRVTAIYSGVDHTTFRPISNAREILTKRYTQLSNIITDQWLLYVGSELPRKNFSMLLTVLSSLLKERLNIKLIKIGSAGGKRFRIETMKIIRQLNLQNNILIFENVQDEDLALFYNSSDLFITASKLEGFGLPILEAMACGVPVICPNTGSLPEITGSNSLQFNINNISNLCDYITYIIDDETMRSKMITNGIAWSLNFTWENTINKLVQIYQNI